MERNSHIQMDTTYDSSPWDSMALSEDFRFFLSDYRVQSDEKKEVIRNVMLHVHCDFVSFCCF